MSGVRGQSDLIGTVLLISVVVTAVSVVGVFVLAQQAENVRNADPPVEFTTDVQDVTVELTHTGGDTFEYSTLRFAVRNDTGSEDYDLGDDGVLVATDRDGDATFEPGESVVVRYALEGELRLLLAETGDGGAVLYDESKQQANTVVATVYPDPDSGQPEDECVVFENRGGGAVNLDGWTVRDAAGFTYTVPPGVTLEAGDSITLHTGTGTDTDTDLYWGYATEKWNDGGDTVFLDNDYGHSVDTFTYDASYSPSGKCAGESTPTPTPTATATSTPTATATSTATATPTSSGGVTYVAGSATAVDVSGNQNKQDGVRFQIENTGSSTRTITDMKVSSPDADQIYESGGASPWDHEVTIDTDLSTADGYADGRSPYTLGTRIVAGGYESAARFETDIAAGDTATIYLYQFQKSAGKNDQEQDMAGSSITVTLYFANGDTVRFTLTP